MSITLNDILNTEPQCLIGYTLDGEPILDMSRAHATHPGHWGHVVSRSGDRIHSGWAIRPSKFRHKEDRDA